MQIIVGEIQKLIPTAEPNCNMLHLRLLLKITQGLKLIQGTVDLWLVCWGYIFQKSYSKATYIRQISSQELSEVCSINLLLAHQHTCSQHRLSRPSLFTEQRRRLKKGVNETANSMTLVFPLGLKQSRIGDIPVWNFLEREWEITSQRWSGMKKFVSTRLAH